MGRLKRISVRREKQLTRAESGIESAITSLIKWAICLPLAALIVLICATPDTDGARDRFLCEVVLLGGPVLLNRAFGKVQPDSGSAAGYLAGAGRSCRIDPGVTAESGGEARPSGWCQ